MSRVFVLSLVLLALSVSLALAMTPSQTDVVIGVVLPLGTPGGQRAKAVLDLALSDVNGGVQSIGGVSPPILSLPLRLAYSDSRQNTVRAIQDVHEFAREEQNLMAVFGSMDPKVTAPMAMAASVYSIALGNAWTQAPSLALEHNVVRLITSGEFIAQAMAQFTTDVKWYRIAIVTTNDDQSRGMKDVYLRELAKYRILGENGELIDPIEIVPIVIPAEDSEVTTATINNAMDSMIKSNVRIFVLMGTQSPAILRAAKARGLISPIHQWFGDFCTDDTIHALSSDGDPASFLFGTVCFTQAQPKEEDQPIPNGILKNQHVANFKQRLIQAKPDIFTADTPLIPSDLIAYDLLVGFALGLRSLYLNSSLPNTPPSLHSVLTTGEFSYQRVDGTTVTIQTNADTISNLDVVNYNSVFDRYIVMGHVDKDTREIVLTEQQLAFMEYCDGTNVFPKDRARIYVDKDQVPFKYDEKVVVLSYVISVLGLWTGLILMEQSSAFWLKLEYKQAVFWTSLAAVAMGACGIWPGFILQASGISIDAMTLLIQPAGIAVSLVFATIFVFAALVVSQQKRFNGQSTQVAVGTKGKKESSQTSTSESASHTASSNRGLISHIQNLKRKAVKELVDMSRYHLKGLLITSAIWLAAIEGCIGIQIELYAMHGSINVPPQAHIVACIFTFITMIGGLMITKTVLRYIGPLIMGLILLGHYHIIMAMSTFTLHPLKDIAENSVVLGGSSAIIVAVTCAVTCLTLMVLNVNQLRVTKNMLDKVLAKVNGQIKSLESDIEHERLQTKAFQEQSEFLRRNVELINLCRPIFRPYAVALALADPVAATTKSLIHDEDKDNKPKSAITQKSNKNELAVPTTSNKSAAAPQKDKDGKVIHVAAAPQSSDKPSKSGEEEKSPVADAGKDLSKSGEASKSGASATHASSKRVTIAADSGAAPNAASNHTANTSSTTSAAANAPTTGANDFTLIHPHKQEKQLVALLNEIKALQLSGPTAPKAVTEIKLPQLLANPTTMEFIKDVLTKQLSPENMALWLDIQRYRSLEQASVRKAMAEEIFSTFIQTGAKFEVNLSSSMKEVVQTKLFKGRVTIDLFDDVEREIYRLINTNNIDTLVQSNMFKLAAMILSHPSYKLPSMSTANNATGTIGNNIVSSFNQQGMGLSQGIGAPINNNQRTHSTSQLARTHTVSQSGNTNQMPVSTNVQNTPRSIARPSSIMIQNSHRDLNAVGRTGLTPLVTGNSPQVSPQMIGRFMPSASNPSSRRPSIHPPVEPLTADQLITVDRQPLSARATSDNQ